jgi:hypothetical protein
MSVLAHSVIKRKESHYDRNTWSCWRYTGRTSNFKNDDKVDDLGPPRQLRLSHHASSAVATAIQQQSDHPLRLLRIA